MSTDQNKRLEDVFYKRINQQLRDIDAAGAKYKDNGRIGLRTFDWSA